MKYIKGLLAILLISAFFGGCGSTDDDDDYERKWDTIENIGWSTRIFQGEDFNTTWTKHVDGPREVIVAFDCIGNVGDAAYFRLNTYSADKVTFEFVAGLATGTKTYYTFNDGINTYNYGENSLEAPYYYNLKTTFLSVAPGTSDAEIESYIGTIPLCN